MEWVPEGPLSVFPSHHRARSLRWFLKLKCYVLLPVAASDVSSLAKAGLSL